MPPRPIPEERTSAWRRLGPDESVAAFRFVHVEDLSAPGLAEDFRSNGERALPRKPGENDPAEYFGLSVFKSFDLAIERRRRIVERLARAGVTPRIGDHLAELALHGPNVILYDANEPDGHMTLWADAELLVTLVTNVTPCDPSIPA